MKKTIAMVLTTAMLAGILAGCGGKTEPTTEPTQAPTTEAATEVTTEATTEATETTAPVGEVSENGALTILQAIWADYAEEDKFPAAGGDMTGELIPEPGTISPENFANLGYTLLIPENYLTQIQEAATLMHMMNANTFTGGVVKMSEDTDLAAFAAEVKEVIRTNPYVCGFPDRMLIAQVDGRLLISFGKTEVMDTFQSHMEAVYPEAEILYTDNIGM